MNNFKQSNFNELQYNCDLQNNEYHYCIKLKHVGSNTNLLMKHLLTFCLTFAVSVTFAQTARPISIYIMGQYNKPFFEWRFKNNPWGIGLGAETFFMIDKKFQPTIDLAGNVFIEKAIVSQSFGSTEKAPDIRSNISLLAGASIHPIRHLYFSFVAGPTLLNQKIYLSTKPSIGFYFDKNRKWTTKISGVIIYNYIPVKPIIDGAPDKEGIGYLQVSVGHRLF